MTVRAIMKPERLTQGYSEGFGAPANLLTSEPKQVATLTGAARPQSICTLDAPTLLDSFWLGYVGGADLSGFSIEFYGKNGAENWSLLAASSLLPTAVSGGRRHALLMLAQPFTATNVALVITGNGPDPASVTMGCFAVGRAFRPQWGGEWGGGIGLTDTGTATRRRDGGFGIDPGVSAAQMQWTFGDLSDAERQQLFGMLKRRGATTQPFLVIEGDDNGPSSTEEVHWGLFTRIEPYERQAPGMSRWSLRFEDWE